MPPPISAADLAASLPEWTVVDVRKPKAHLVAEFTVAGCTYRSPFSADHWWNEFRGRRVAAFCVHGHEVSQAVAGFLGDQGIEARYVAGGFEGWLRAGLPVRPIERGE